MKLEFNYYSGWVGVGWSDKTKVILNSTQFKFKLKLELSLAIKSSKEKKISIVRHFEEAY